jgi:transposase
MVEMDLNETNALVAVDGEERVLFVNGKMAKVRRQRGTHRRHVFACPHCGFQEHADRWAARNIQARFTVLRSSGLPSASPKAHAGGATGKSFLGISLE